MSYRQARCDSRGKKKKLDHTQIRNSKNGGHTVEHHYHNSLDFKNFKGPEIYSFSTGPEMIKHLMDAHGVMPAQVLAHLQQDNDAEPAAGQQEDQYAED